MDYSKLKGALLREGNVRVSDEIQTKVRHNYVTKGDVLQLPNEVECFIQTVQMENGNVIQTEFVLLCTETTCKRVYLSWLNNCTGTVSDSLQDCVDFKEFFKNNARRKFSVAKHIVHDTNKFVYEFNWVD